MTRRFFEKVALVTGGTSGIGEAIATRLAQEGATVIVLGRRQQVLDAAVRRIGHGATGYAADVSDPTSVQSAVRQVVAQHDRIDVLVANAGGGVHAPLGQIDPVLIDQQFATNVKGVIITAQEALPYMSAGGAIVIVGSTASMDSPAGMSVYSATKGALRPLVRSWLADTKGLGIRINIVRPGPTNTQALTDSFGENAEAAVKSLVEQSPLGRIGEPREIAAVAAFLASDDASYVNGIELFADGGISQY
ncbi:SDR family NAD(P)-dependent oxidoreductase [uncultured Jannaschia sp.]|uniref:SDR family NAD(P)-dependent oxidoreductase n=1 Tax=uncultured Jannaschia sp. TaxID=293347 RepID=UPI00261993E0|nr:SDR family oxidoreductase [uncultured Jannaschia sp.]